VFAQNYEGGHEGLPLRSSYWRLEGLRYVKITLCLSEGDSSPARGGIRMTGIALIYQK